MTGSFPKYFADLYRQSGGEKVGLGFEEFAAILESIGGDENFLRALRLEELALARACARGSEAAWDRFIERFRSKLFLLALAIAREDAIAHELADELYADLFGTRVRAAGGRNSKFESYSGRGSLEGWLKTVLAQQYIDRLRSRRNLVSFEEQVEAGTQFAGRHEQPAMKDARLEQATEAALAKLPSEDRLILASYYLDRRKLAEIGRMLGVHESTVSRRLEKITAGVRKAILKGLRERGVSAREAEQLLHSDVRELNLDVAGRLAQEAAGPSFHGKGPAR